MSSQKLNVLFTFYIPSGGVETLNRQRLYALSQAGITCHFLYSQSGTGLQNKTDAALYVTNTDLGIKEILQKGSYDAIVVGSDLSMLQRLRTLGYEGILIFESQGIGHDKDYAEKFVKAHALPIINPYCDAILYPKTPHLIKAFETYFPAKKKYSFHNCFNSRDFHYRQLPKKPNPIIGWVGRLEENKNWRDFLMIGAKLIRKNPSIRLWMFEDSTLAPPDQRKAFETVIKQLNLQSHLTVFANLPHDRMADHYSMIGDSGGFLCSTSKVEGFGYAVLEAMICRCPVLSTDSDGVRHFIIHNITGKFFTLGNIQHAVKEGHDLIANTSLREAIRQRASQHIQQNFSPGEYAAHFLNMITELKQLKK